jgi:hypothetical protein
MNPIGLNFLLYHLMEEEEKNLVEGLAVSFLELTSLMLLLLVTIKIK